MRRCLRKRRCCDGETRFIVRILQPPVACLPAVCKALRELRGYGQRVTRHFIVDGKSILFSTVQTPLRHLFFADRILLSTKLCSQIEIFLLELCVQSCSLQHADRTCGTVRRQGLKLSEKYFRQNKGTLAELCCFHTQWVKNRPHTQLHAAFSCSFYKLSPVFKHFLK